jgi:hypothetical protein
LLALLDDGDWQALDFRADNASSDGLSLSFSSSFGSVALSARSEEKFESGAGEDTLFHGKTVLIIATGNFEDISLEFVTKWISFNLLPHSFFKENSALIIVIDVDGFSGTVDGVGDGELRLGR